MTSSRLWLLLSILAIPAFLWTTTGCEIVFPLDAAAPTTTAYTCACTCEAGPLVRAIPVSVRPDDAIERLADGDVTLGDNDLPMTTASLIGVRFAALGIPPGAIITSAYVQFTADANEADPTTIDIRIEASDDAPTFADTNFNLSGRAVESPTAAWIISSPWATNDAGAAQQTPDLTLLVQEVVDRGGWNAGSSLVLLFAATSGGRTAESFDGSAAEAPTLHVTYEDPSAAVTANLPVCLPENLNQNITPGAPNADVDSNDADNLPDVLVNDCTNRIENTYKGLIGACGYNDNPGANCSCQLVQTNFRDNNPPNGMQDAGEAYFGYPREICNEGCVGEAVTADCANFDPVGFGNCVAPLVAFCADNGIAPENCNIDACLPLVAATHAAMDDPVCIAHASDAPKPLAFQLLGRRSLCDVSGQATIQVGNDMTEPQQDPVTRGTVEIFGGPCPGESCPVGIATQLGMNPITFSVKWARDPTFTDLSHSGNSFLGAAALDSAGVGMFPENSTVGVARGRRSDNRKAFFGTNATPIGFAVDWSGFACSLEGNLAGDVDAEDIDGLCDGDDATVCRNDSPDCDTAGGPCVFPADPEPLNVIVALSGPLVNQPPTAIAPPVEAECTSTAGGAFLLDGSQTVDPDGNINQVSWRIGDRLGPEAGFDLTLPGALGVGESQSYVLRVIDEYAQMDEVLTTATVVDTTPPVVSAEWIPIPARLRRDDAYRIEFSATDICDAEPTTIGIVETPPVDGLRIRQLKTRTPPRVRFDLKHKKLRIQGVDPAATLAQLMTLGGLQVLSGQETSKVEILAPHKQVWKLEFQKDGKLEIEAVSVVLRVEGTDASGNTSVVHVSP